MADAVRCADGVVRRSLGAWNAYVETGETLEIRRARLAEVPADWREAVRSHLAMVFALRASARRRAG